MDAKVLGISFDTPEDNKRFCEEHNFGFPLLSDVERTVGHLYGAARGPDEQYPDFPKRLTFLIDPQGVVAKTYEVTDVAAHPGEVIDDLRELQASR